MACAAPAAVGRGGQCDSCADKQLANYYTRPGAKARSCASVVALHARRRAAGVCIRGCGRPLVTATDCRECADHRNQQNRDKKAAARAAAPRWCACGVELTGSLARKSCAACSKQRYRVAAIAAYRELQSAGVCPMCRTGWLVPGKSRCSPCLAVAAAKQNARNARKRP